jgi:hypothetical protein
MFSAKVEAEAADLVARHPKRTFVRSGGGKAWLPYQKESFRKSRTRVCPPFPPISFLEAEEVSAPQACGASKCRGKSAAGHAPAKERALP